MADTLPPTSLEERFLAARKRIEDALSVDLTSGEGLVSRMISDLEGVAHAAEQWMVGNSSDILHSTAASLVLRIGALMHGFGDPSHPSNAPAIEGDNNGQA